MTTEQSLALPDNGTDGELIRGQTGWNRFAGPPEPDGSVVRGRRSDYVARHPGPEDVALLVEVADTSLERDRGWKKRIYAAAGIDTGDISWDFRFTCTWIAMRLTRNVGKRRI